jgi:tetratricopeptide (TPR) repeat protein
MPMANRIVFRVAAMLSAGLLLGGCGSHKADDSAEQATQAHFNRGLAYWKKGDFDKAIADCTEAIRFKPDYAQAYNKRGVIYVANCESGKAIADATEAIRLKPGFAEAYAIRGLAYEKKGDMERSRKDLQRAKELKPEAN